MDDQKCRLVLETLKTTNEFKKVLNFQRIYFNQQIILVKVIKTFGIKELRNLLGKNRIDSEDKITKLSFENLNSAFFGCFSKAARKIPMILMSTYNMHMILTESTFPKMNALFDSAYKIVREMSQLKISQVSFLKQSNKRATKFFFFQTNEFIFTAENEFYFLEIIDLSLAEKTTVKKLKEEKEFARNILVKINDQTGSIYKMESENIKMTEKNQNGVLSVKKLHVTIKGPISQNSVLFDLMFSKISPKFLQNKFQMKSLFQNFGLQIVNFVFEFQEKSLLVISAKQISSRSHVNYFADIVQRIVDQLSKISFIDKVTLALIKQKVDQATTDLNFCEIFKSDQMGCFPTVASFNDIFINTENTNLDSSFPFRNSKIVFGNFEPQIWPRTIYFCHFLAILNQFCDKKNNVDSFKKVTDSEIFYECFLNLKLIVISEFENFISKDKFKSNATDPLLLSSFLVICENLNRLISCKPVCVCFTTKTISLNYVNEAYLCVSCRKMKECVSEICNMKFLSVEERQRRLEGKKKGNEMATNVYIPQRRYYVPTPNLFGEKSNLEKMKNTRNLMKNPSINELENQLIFMHPEIQDNVEKNWKKKFNMNFRLTEFKEEIHKKGIYVDVIKKEDVKKEHEKTLK